MTNDRVAKAIARLGSVGVDQETAARLVRFIRMDAYLDITEDLVDRSMTADLSGSLGEALAISYALRFSKSYLDNERAAVEALSWGLADA